MTEINTSNINRVWADLLIEELVRAGAGLFCLSPGSRNTPLTTAVAANPRADHVIHYDERGSAFFALGYARATRRPAVWITTSGTAVANGMPAVVEASVDGLPMLLLTADRPPELRQTGSNQTIDQVKIFGDFVRWQFDLPAPDRSIDPAMVLTAADQAAYRARRMPAGPVHLNAMFREPLSPDDDNVDYGPYLEHLRPWRERRRPYTQYAAGSVAPDPSELRALRASLRGVRRGLVVAGRLDTVAQGDSVRWLAERLQWPLLPDPGSQLRLGTDSSVAAPHYDLALHSEAFRSGHPPEAVLYFGGRSTSKRVNQFLASARPDPFIVVRENPGRLDPYHRVTRHIETDIISFCHELLRIDDDRVDTSERTAPDAGWLDDWTRASSEAEKLITSQLASDVELSEPACARIISAEAPEASGLVVASSMPVRDIDAFGARDGKAPFVAANRGASGIDGSIATAAGLAHGLRSVVTLLIGDLAALHDLNSLAYLHRSPAPVIVIVINNHGGGIFSFLPIARHSDVFETYFGTPHDLTFEHAAAMFGLAYRHVTSTSELRSAYREAIQSGSSQILEVTTDREQNLALHRHIEMLISKSMLTSKSVPISKSTE